MSFVITPYVLVCLATTIITLVVGLVSLGHKGVPGAAALGLLMLNVAEWSLGAALELSSVGIPAKIFWSKVEYLGTLSAPVFYLILALEYNRMEHWLTRRRIAMLFVIPVIAFLLAVTNEWHSLIWNSFTPSPAGGNLLVYGHGAAFWALVVGYSYLMVLSGSILFIWAVLRFPSGFDRQSLTILVGVAVPLAGSVIYISGRSPAPGLDITPISFAVCGIFLLWGMLSFQLFDLVPVARDLLIERMSDGVLLLDSRGRIVDTNPAFQRMFTTIRIGDQGSDVFAPWPALLEGSWESTESRSEVITSAGSLELSISPLFDRRGRFIGRLIMVRDISERRNSEQALQEANQSLRSQLAEIEALQASLREQALRDPLTGLYNRRFLTEKMEQELARASRSAAPLSLVIIDIDYFKDFNDLYGHDMGDQVLRQLGKFFLKSVRISDTVCRFGGDEFIILLPGAASAAALKRAEAWRKAAAQVRIEHAGQTLGVSFSAGVACYPEHGRSVDELLHRADQVLYSAKAGGRSRASLEQTAPDEPQEP
jgi:diguanylate cyclase (GGDEF)-like protein